MRRPDGQCEEASEDHFYRRARTAAEKPQRMSAAFAELVARRDLLLNLTRAELGPSSPPEGTGRRRYPALRVLGHSIATDAVVIVDDANREGEREMVRRWSSELGWDVEWLVTARGCAILRRLPASRANSSTISLTPTAR